MDKDEISELAARVVERDGLSPEGERLTTEEIGRSVLNIAALDQRAFEVELGLKENGWQYHGQKFIPQGAFGGGMLRVASMAEIYIRPQHAGRMAERLEFWWISPDNIGKVVRNGKEYPHPAPEVIRMLVK